MTQYDGAQQDMKLTHPLAPGGGNKENTGGNNDEEHHMWAEELRKADERA